MGAVETLICWENLDIVRYQLKNPVTGGIRFCSDRNSFHRFKIAFIGLTIKFLRFLEEKLLYLDPDQEKNKTHFTESSVCHFVFLFTKI